jgi:hypothetical protein
MHRAFNVHYAKKDVELEHLTRLKGVAFLFRMV